MRAPKRPNPKTPTKLRHGRVTGGYFHVSKTYRHVSTPTGKELVANPGVTYSAGRREFKDKRAAEKAVRRTTHRARKQSLRWTA